MIDCDSKNSIDWLEDGLGIFSVWHLNCYGVHVFLCVGDVDVNSNMVMLYELKTVRYKAKDGRTGTALSYDERGGAFRAKERNQCLIAPISKQNCFSRPPLKAYIKKNKKGEFIIPFEVDYDSRLYYEIKKKGIYKDYMCYNLKMVFKFQGGRKKYRDLMTTYWPDESQEQKQIVMNVSEKVYDA